MEIPFGPRNLRLELGSMYKAYGRKNQGYPDELGDVDYCVAAAVLQIINCHGGRWSNGIIDVGRIEGSTWDMLSTVQMAVSSKCRNHGMVIY